MLKDVRNVRVGLGSLLPILVRSHQLLIPDPLHQLIIGTNFKLMDLGSVTMTVSINTRTRVDASEVASSKTVNIIATDPAQLVTDQQNLNQVRGTYFAYGISLDLSCDPRGSIDTWTSNAESPDQ